MSYHLKTLNWKRFEVLVKHPICLKEQNRIDLIYFLIFFDYIRYFIIEFQQLSGVHKGRSDLVINYMSIVVVHHIPNTTLTSSWGTLSPTKLITSFIITTLQLKYPLCQISNTEPHPFQPLSTSCWLQMTKSGSEISELEVIN